MSRLIAEGWPAEYAGPRDVLGPGFIAWAGRPRIVENNTGEWIWVCTPNFIPDHSLDDLQRLRTAGWHVKISASAGWLRIRISERVNP